jgi:putative pyruvate formate lyase activating enzyme
LLSFLIFPQRITLETQTSVLLKEPGYLRLSRSGKLAERAAKLEAMLTPCTICPLDCRVDRMNDEIARCYSGRLPIVSTYCSHYGEEPALVGTDGVGNIFFGNCNLRCVYCQNHEISQNHRIEMKNAVTHERLAEIMLELQAKGCHSIGLVSPTHFVPQIVRSLVIAADAGLNLPLIYNTNAYDSIEVLKLLDGIIDIYLPDLKYSSDEAGWHYSRVPRYVEVSRTAAKEMHRQVGSEIVIDEEGLIRRGLIIRHLILPNDLAGSEETLRWIRDNFGKNVTLSIMAQYYPTHKVFHTELLNRKIYVGEYERVLRLLERLELENGWAQEWQQASEYYRPEFQDRAEPFKGREQNFD